MCLSSDLPPQLWLCVWEWCTCAWIPVHFGDTEKMVFIGRSGLATKSHGERA